MEKQQSPTTLRVLKIIVTGIVVIMVLPPIIMFGLRFAYALIRGYGMHGHIRGTL